MQLKPHDTVVALKYGCLAMRRDVPNEFGRITVRYLADSLGLSPGEVSKSNQRLLKAKLIAPLVRSDGHSFVEYNTVVSHMREWLCYGIQYNLLVEPQGLGNGLATAWSNDNVESEVVPRDVPHVWLFPGGTDYGEGISPLYPKAPVAAYDDEHMYYILSLIDAIRLGKPRELKIARALVESFLDDMSRAQ